MATASGNGDDELPNEAPGGDPKQPIGTFPFLRLPAELRREVYKYLLAPATQSICNYVSTGILATNRQVHDEARPILYGHWAPRLQASLDAASMDVAEFRSEMAQHLTHNGTFAQSTPPVCIVLSTGDIIAVDPKVHHASLLQAGQQLAMSDAMPREIGRAIRNINPAVQDVVVHLDIASTEPDPSDVHTLLICRFLGNLRVRRVTLEIHAPGREADNLALIRQWVQAVSTKVGQNAHIFVPGAVVTVQPYK